MKATPRERRRRLPQRRRRRQSHLCAVDATLNGALDSADAATDMVLADILERRQSAHNQRRFVITHPHF
jgi:hypothetical protein